MLFEISQKVGFCDRVGGEGQSSPPGFASSYFPPPTRQHPSCMIKHNVTFDFELRTWSGCMPLGRKNILNQNHFISLGSFLTHVLTHSTTLTELRHHPGSQSRPAGNTDTGRPARYGAWKRVTKWSYRELRAATLYIEACSHVLLIIIFGSFPLKYPAFLFPSALDEHHGTNTHISQADIQHCQQV